MRFTNSLKILVLIVAAGFLLRLYGSTLMPLYGDELTLVYDAYSILKTGHDQNGVFLPLTFQMAEGRPAGYVYFSIPFVAIFGSTLLGARMLSILSGVGIIILIYLLGRKLVNEKVGLLSAALFSISPWGIQLGSGGFETHFALFLTLLGVVLFLNSKSKPYFLPLSALSLGLAIHTYSTYKLTVPLLILTLIFFVGRLRSWSEKKFVSWAAAAVIVVGLSGGLLINQALTAGSEGRFLNLNAFSREDLREQIVQKVNTERSLDRLPERLPSFFHNRNLEYAFVISESFVNNFSPEFLFWHGDGNPRHNGATMGELYPIELLFVLTGLFYLAGIKRGPLKLMVPWLLIAPLPATLLLETHALRSSLMLPPLILLSAVGIYYLWNLAGSGKVKWVLPVVFLVQFLIFADRFYFLAPQSFGRFWSYPAKVVSDKVLENKNKFDYIVLSDSLDNIEFAYPVYTQVDPKVVIEQNSKPDRLDKYTFKRFDNVYIGSVPDGEVNKFVDNLNGSVLYFGPPNQKQALEGYTVFLGPDQLPMYLKVEKVR